jgi:hypothetical protein
VDIFIKHYEKVVLGFFLLLLLLSGVLVLGAFDRSKKELEQKKQEAVSKAKGGSILPTLDPARFTAEENLRDTRKTLAIVNTAKDDPKGSLIVPNRYVKCFSEKCNYLLALSSDTCPFCDTKQLELGKDSEEGDDTDGDGIPDLVEQKYPAFLHYLNPQDARQDYDNDGFLNIEEYRAQTAMDDPDVFPPLGNLVRCIKTFRRPLPLQLRNVDTYNSTDKAKWEIALNYFDVRTQRQRSRTLLIGESFMDFKLLDAGFDGEGDTAAAFAIISPVNDPNTRYRLAQNLTVTSNDVTVQFVYLYNRMREYQRLVLTRFVTVKNVGEEFHLQKQKSTGLHTEYYRILAADETKNTITIGRLEAPKGEVNLEIQVPPYNLNDDVGLPNTAPMGGGDMGMPPGGDGMMPGNMRRQF